MRYATPRRDLLSLLLDIPETLPLMLTKPSTDQRTAQYMAPTTKSPLRIRRSDLETAIEQAFVESRFSNPQKSMHVCVHGNGRVFIAQLALHVTQEGFNVFSLECNGTPERPSSAAPVPETWSREEFTGWVRSRPDLYTAPLIEQLLHKADRKNIRIQLVD